MKTQKKEDKKKSALISFGVHIAILLAAFIPLASKVHTEVAAEVFYEIPIEFAEYIMSGEEGSKAASHTPDPEIKPVVDAQHEEPAAVEAEQISEVTQSNDDAEPIESEITDDTSEEVAASEDSIEGDASETTSAGGSDGSLIEGESEGAGMGDGDGLSGMDGDGDGIITRKVIHREDISRAAEYNGTIAVDICIDRRGYVVSVAKNAERTTITDSDIIRKALDIAAGYRFEANYNTAKRECGIMTFVFEIEDEDEGAYVIVE